MLLVHVADGEVVGVSCWPGDGSAQEAVVVNYTPDSGMPPGDLALLDLPNGTKARVALGGVQATSRILASDEAVIAAILARA